MAHRYYFEEARDGNACIAGADAAHLTRVLRVQPGQHLPLCDGAGFNYTGEVLQAGPDGVLLRLGGKTPSEAEPALRVLSCIAWAKGDKMDWAVQKAVEAGAADILLFPGEKSVSKPKNVDNKLERLRRVAHEAAKQSARGVLPQVDAAGSFGEMLQQVGQRTAAALLFHPEGTLTLKAALAAAPAGPLAFITGPESGFADGECRQAQAAGATLVQLGPRILRCETAPLVALAAAMALSGAL